MKSQFILFILLAGCFLHRNYAQDFDLITKVAPGDRVFGGSGNNTHFGSSVAVSGNYAIVGASNESKDANAQNSMSSAGAAYIYVKQGGSWVEIQKIVASDRSARNNFGYSVAMEGDYAVIGASHTATSAALAGPGAVYVFKREGETWVEKQKIVATDGANTDRFGTSVSISGDYIVVGAPQEDEDAGGLNTVNNAGSAYIFHREGETWTQQQKITAPVRGAGWLFGYAVAIENNTVVVGSYTDASEGIFQAGAVYVYTREGSSWSLQQKITASDLDGGQPMFFPGNRFGNSVGISGDYIAVGAYYNPLDADGQNSIEAAGAAYIFKREGTNWTQKQKLVSPIRGSYRQFGSSIAIEGDYVLIGEPLEEGGYGAAYLYKREGENFVQQQKITANDRQSSDTFSGDIHNQGVAINGDNILIGAPKEEHDATGSNSSRITEAGSAYFFGYCDLSIPTFALPPAICAGETTDLVINTAATNTINWYTNADDSEPVYTGTTYRVENLTETTTWWIEAEIFHVSDCISERTQITLTVNPLPELTVAETNITICEGSTTLSASSQGNTINWYDSEEGETPVFTGTAFETPGLTETTTYWVEAVNPDTGCTSGRTEVTVTVNPLPQLNIEITSVTTCENTSVILTASSPNYTINWYDSEEAETPVFTGEEFQTPALTETTSFWVEAANTETGCPSERTEVVVTIIPAPVIIFEDTTPEICSGTAAILNATSAGNIIFWYDSAEATQFVGYGNQFTTPELTETTSYWAETMSEAGCKSVRTEIVITVNLTVTPSFETVAPVCEGTDFTLPATSLNGITGTWSPAFNPSATTVYMFTPDEGQCAEPVTIEVIVIPSPELTLDTPEFVCSGNAASLYGYSAGNVVFWYDSQEAVDYLYHGNNFVTPALTETTSFWVEAYNLSTGCSSERVEVMVTVNPIPEAPEAVTLQYFEEGETLADLEVSYTGDITWYADESLTVELPSTTPLVAGTTYYVTQTIGGCESEAIGITVEIELRTNDSNTEGFSYYPNPVKDILVLKGQQTIDSVTVYDLSGRLVKTEKYASQEVNVDLKSLTAGTYLVKVASGKDVQTIKIIKK